LNLKNIINENISLSLQSSLGDTNTSAYDILNTHINFKTRYTNSHLFLIQFFEKFFSILPNFVYFNEHYTLFFLLPTNYNLIFSKFKEKKSEFCRKFTKKVFFIKYPNQITLSQLIQNLFQHVPIQLLDYDIDDNEFGIISIYIFVAERHVKYALGRNGDFIKMINNLLHQHLDRRITFYIRSIGFDDK
jgi:hypothetical protein